MRFTTSKINHAIVAIAVLLCFVMEVSAQQPYRGGSGKMNKLVWSDEFDYSGAPDSTKWSYEQGYIRNKELQYYTNRRENAVVQQGRLHITARRYSLRQGDKIYPITSASVTTKHRQAWTYGRMEIKAKIPSSLGTWPAIWILGTNIDTVRWPMCGEIDILEHVGYMPDTVHFNVHTGKYNHAVGTGKGTRIPYRRPFAGFHIYAIEWFPDRIDWYMDDKKVFTYANEKTGEASWPFDKPQYLLLNLAFGGAWGGTKGVDENSLPQTMEVEYVRVFQ